jgi:type I site-specific restriction endonuclease
LLGRKGQNLAVLEAKDDKQGDVYLAKEQARGYALAMEIEDWINAGLKHLINKIR